MGTTKSLFRKSAIPAVLIVLAAGALHVQAAQDVVVKVPFAFEAGGIHFDAGVYTLSMDKVTSGSVVVESADHSRRTTLLTRTSISAPVVSAPVVSFRSDGESRFLSAIQSESASHRWEIVPTNDAASPARASATSVVAGLRSDRSK